MDALIGSSGFVGSTLLKQHAFERMYRSTNIGDIDGQSFHTVVCAGAPARKWMANRDPEADRQTIEGLIGHLEAVTCKVFVLISTVDVFRHPVAVDENSPVDESGLHAYGLHRRQLERFVERHFPDHLIVRLPGLVGPGLRKNIIFDFLNGNNLQAIDSRGHFQFYPMVNLWHDVKTALDAGLRLVHLTAEPISAGEVSQQGFGRRFDHALDDSPAAYDMRTRYAAMYGAEGAYQYSRRDTIQAIRAYAQMEPRALDTPQGRGA
jgi:nucleoside-diphosphate-sugar epimerase